MARLVWEAEVALRGARGRELRMGLALLEAELAVWRCQATQRG